MFSFKKKCSKLTKKDYKALQDAIIEQLVKDSDGNNVIDPDFFYQACDVELGSDGKPKKLTYNPEKYKKAKKVTKKTTVETYTHIPKPRHKDILDKSPSELYLDHLSGDIRASEMLDLEPYYKEKY